MGKVFPIIAVARLAARWQAQVADAARNDCPPRLFQGGQIHGPSMKVNLKEGNMQVISTRVHGVIDYLTGGLLLVAPWLFGFATGGIAQWLPMLLGAAIIGMSLLTRYELGVVRIIPLRVHLGVDAAGGLLLAVSPWLFGFASLVWVPHLVVGLMEIVVPLLTRRDPFFDRQATSAERSSAPRTSRPGTVGTTAEGVHVMPTGSASAADKDAIGAAATDGATGTTDTGVHRLPITPSREGANKDDTPKGSSADRRG
jgi:hypothetical protein